MLVQDVRTLRLPRWGLGEIGLHTVRRELSDQICERPPGEGQKEATCGKAKMSSWTLNNPRTLAAEAATSSTRELRTISDFFLADREAVAVVIELVRVLVSTSRVFRGRDLRIVKTEICLDACGSCPIEAKFQVGPRKMPSDLSYGSNAPMWGDPGSMLGDACDNWYSSSSCQSSEINPHPDRFAAPRKGEALLPRNRQII